MKDLSLPSILESVVIYFIVFLERCFGFFLFEGMEYAVPSLFFGRLDARNQMNCYWTLLLHDQIAGTEASVEFLATQNLIN